MRAVRRPLAAILLSLQVASCTSWRVASVSPAQLIAEEQPAKIRVTRSDGTRLVLHQPSVQGDSLVGSHAAGIAGPDRAVALVDVTAVARRRGDTGRTVLLGVGVAALLAGTIAFAATADFCCPGQ
jgi:hypothetical protein